MKLDSRSEHSLAGVHADLRRLVIETEPPYPVVIVDGVRDVRHQVKYVEAGASDTMNSRHLTGHAIDFAVFPNGLNNSVSWDFGLYKECAKAFKKKADELGIPITWGGDWGLRDGMHIQLTWADYPLAKLARVKTRANSTTVAATGGIGALAIIQQLLPMMENTDSVIVEWGALALLLLLAGYVCHERILKIDKEGV